MATPNNFAERLDTILDKFDEDLKVAKKRKDEAISKLMKDLLALVDCQKPEVQGERSISM